MSHRVHGVSKNNPFDFSVQLPYYVTPCTRRFKKQPLWFFGTTSVWMYTYFRNPFRDRFSVQLFM